SIEVPEAIDVDSYMAEYIEGIRELKNTAVFHGSVQYQHVFSGTEIFLSVKNRLDEVKFRCFPVKRTLRRQECSPRRSGGERTVYLSCSTKRFPPSCCFASRRQRSNETDAGRPVQRKLLAAGPANHTGGSRNRHGGDWLPGRPQGEGFRNPESGFCDRCGDVLRV